MKLFTGAALLIFAVSLFAAESLGGQAPPRAARSVHLGWMAPESDAFYLEMTVQESTPGSYFMACGWNTGYFGVQELNDGRKVAIFSVWDPTQGDDPNRVSHQDQVELLHQSERVRIRRFGGEGTGAQCMTDFPWEVGQTLRFLVQASVEGEKTAYAGYLYSPDSEEWTHLVTFRTRTGGQPLKGLYSFVEDFRRDSKSVDEIRRATFGSGWVRTIAGAWAPLSRARFTASRADWEAKENINAGWSGRQFFLATGGDVKQETELRTVIDSRSTSIEKPAPLEQFIASASSGAIALEPIPDKLVVLTFDDSSTSHFTIARPLLKRFGFSATFFITEGFTFATNKTDYMTWEQIAQLHREGFEIGNHTRDHMGLSKKNLPRLPEQVAAINERCDQYGIPRPTSFAYPGNALEPEALPLLKELGFRFARRGGAPEFPYEPGHGPAYEPGRDHPLLIPSAGDARPAWTLDNFKRAVNQARDGKIAVLQFHGVPDGEHPWVNTPSEQFELYMEYLHQNGFRVIAMRDLSRYVDPDHVPEDPWSVINERRAAVAD